MTRFCDGGASHLSPEDGVTATGETFAHNDGSWPCLKGINLSGATTDLHYIVPSGYFDAESDSSFNMSLQNIPLEDRTYMDKTQGFPTYTLFNGSNIKGARYRFFLAEQSAPYNSDYPTRTTDASWGLGSTCHQVDSCADTGYLPTDLTSWSQFSFTATVPASLYSTQFTVTKEVVEGTDDANCVLNVAVDCSDSYMYDMAGTTVGDEDMAFDAGGCLTQTLATNSNPAESLAFGKSQCLCLNSATAGWDVKFCSDGGGQQACTTDNNTNSGNANALMAAYASVPRNYVSANFRDGYQRLQAEDVMTLSEGVDLLPTYLNDDTDTVCWGRGENDVWPLPASKTDAGQLYTGYIKPYDQGAWGRGSQGNSDPYNVPDQVSFTSTNTCMPPPTDMEDQNAMVMMDVDRYDTQYPVRRVFVNLKWTGSNSDPKPLFAQSNGDYVQSFNVVARMPTCLSREDATPTGVTNGYNDDFRAISCYDTDHSYNPWTWTKNVNLGYAAGTYAGGTDGAWDATTHSSWPSMHSTVSTDYPDIVVRLAFANTYLVDPATGIPMELTVDNSNFESNMVTVWGQNKPNSALQLTSQVSNSLLTQDMRAIALYEYAAAVLYRGLFASYLTASSITGDPTNRWYSVANNLIQTGVYNPYGAPEYFNDYFTTFLPTSYALTPGNSGTVQNELASLSQDLVANASDYFRYPRIRYETSTQTLWVDFYCDLYTHLNLLNAQGGTIQQYLRNMYQDSDLATIQSGTTVLMSPGSTSAAPDIVLTGSATHDPSSNLVWTGTDSTPLTFTTSYYWTQAVTKLSPVAVIWMGITGAVDTPPGWLDWYSTIGWNTLKQWAPTGVPQLIAPTEIDAIAERDPGVYTACLSANPLTYACAEKLCPSSSLNGCLCDYSITLDTITYNPANSVYFNNSNGACRCLANPSYPVGADDNYRAWNPVTACFSQACLDYGFPEEQSVISCETTGCTSFTDAVERADRSLADGTWTEAFGSQGAGLNLDEIETTCGLEIVVDESTDQQFFFVNWFALGVCVCLALTVPMFVGLDFVINKLNRGLVYYLAFGVLGFLLASIGALLFYGLSGVRTCVDPDTGRAEYDYDTVVQGRCVDRLTGQIELTADACNDAPPAFCQCDEAETTCGGYFGGNATCSANHMCCVCTNSCFGTEIASGTVSLDSDQVSTSVLLCGISVFVFLTAVVVATVPASIGKATQVWDGKKYVTREGRGPLVQWGTTGLLIAGLGGGIGAGVYYGSQVLPVTAHQINRALQETDLSSGTVCGTSV